MTKVIIEIEVPDGWEQFVSAACETAVAHARRSAETRVARPSPSSKEAMIRKFANSGGSANGLCFEIAQRYWRIKRYTCFDVAEHRRNASEMYVAFRKKFPVSYHLSNHLESAGVVEWGRGRRIVWLNGKRVELDAHQRTYIEKLLKIRDKLRAAEYRMGRLGMAA